MFDRQTVKDYFICLAFVWASFTADNAQAQTCVSLFVPDYATNFELYRSVLENLSEQVQSGVTRENLNLLVNDQIKSDTRIMLELLTAKKQQILKNIQKYYSLAYDKLLALSQNIGADPSLLTHMRYLNLLLEQSNEIFELTTRELLEISNLESISHQRYYHLTRLASFFVSFTDRIMNQIMVQASDSNGKDPLTQFLARLTDVNPRNDLETVLISFQYLNPNLDLSLHKETPEYKRLIGLIDIPVTVPLDEIESNYWVSRGFKPLDLSTEHGKYDGIGEIGYTSTPLRKRLHDEEHSNDFLRGLIYVIETTSKAPLSQSLLEKLKSDFRRMYDDYQLFLDQLQVMTSKKRILHELIWFYWTYETYKMLPTLSMKVMLRSQRSNDFYFHVGILTRRLNSTSQSPYYGVHLLDGAPVTKDEIKEVITEQSLFYRRYESYHAETGLRINPVFNYPRWSSP